MRICESINAVTEAPEGYELWIEKANAKLNEVDEAIEKTEKLDIDIEKFENITTVTITKKDGNQKSVEIKDGKDGYTPQKGIDYFDGEPGPQGEPRKRWSCFRRTN